MKQTFLLLSIVLSQCSILGLILSPSLTARSLAQNPPQTKIKYLSGSVALKMKSTVLSFGKKGAPFPEYKEALIQYPIVTEPMASGVLDRAVLQKVQDAISLKKVLGQSLEEIRQEYSQYHWLTQVSYLVNYNRNYILDLTYTISGVGAYPSESKQYIAVNLKTGQRIIAKDLFKADAVGTIAQVVDQMMQREIQRKIAEVKQQEPAFGTELYANHRFQAKHLEQFTIGEKGITFHYDFEFPHVVLAAEPSEDYFLPYAKLKPYLRPEGLLGFYLEQKKI